MYFLRSWLECLEEPLQEKYILLLTKFLPIFLYHVCFIELCLTFTPPRKPEPILEQPLQQNTASRSPRLCIPPTPPPSGVRCCPARSHDSRFVSRECSGFRESISGIKPASHTIISLYPSLGMQIRTASPANTDAPYHAPLHECLTIL